MMSRFVSKLGLVLAASVSMTGAALAADLKIGFVASLTGPAASMGQAYAKGIQAALAYQGEIGGRKIQLIQLDDASDPSQASRDARKLVDEEKVDLLIGSSGVPASVAMAAVARESRTPLVAITPLSLNAEDAAWGRSPRPSRCR